MGKEKKNAYNVIKNYPKRYLYTIFIAGLLLTILFRNSITGLFFSGKTFDGRNLLYQVLFVLFFTLMFSAIVFGVSRLLSKIKWIKQKESKFDQAIMQYYEQVKTDEKTRIYLFIIIVALGTALIFLFNNVLSSINVEDWTFTYKEDLPVYPPVGMDFRQGLYRPAEKTFLVDTFKEFWNNDKNFNAYPPLATLLGLFYLPFSENAGYLVHVAVLLILNFINIILAFLICKNYVFTEVKLEKFSGNIVLTVITICIAFFSFSNYPFKFSIERGNIDTLAIFFSLLFIWTLLKYPEKKWAQVIYLTIATNLKIYPAILFFVLLRKHGKKMILPAIISNIVAFLILGPNNAIAFVKTITDGFGVDKHPYPWIGNNSAFSYVTSLIQNYHYELKDYYIIFAAIFILVPLLMWGLSTILLFKKTYSPDRVALFYLISVPIMCILPTVSHDYKLIILNSVFIILVVSILKQFIQKPKLVDLIQLVALLAVMLLLGRSYIYIDGGTNFYIGNKYPWLICLEIIIFWHILRSQGTQFIEKTNPIKNDLPKKKSV